CVVRCQLGLLLERNPTQLWITSICRPAVFKECLGDQTARLKVYRAGKKSFGAIRQTHFLIQYTKLYEGRGYHALPLVNRHRTTHISLRIFESSARFGDLRGRQIPLRNYGPPKL